MKTDEDSYSFGAEGGQLDYYVMGRPNAKRGLAAIHRTDRADEHTAKMGDRVSSVPLQL